MDSEAADSAEQAARRKAGLDRPGGGGATDSAPAQTPSGAAPAGRSPAAEPDVEAIHGDAPGAADAEAPTGGGARERGVEG
jgi:hypothetical protein